MSNPNSKPGNNIRIHALNVAQDVIRLDFSACQFVVFNPTANAVKIAYGTDVTPTIYDFIVNATKMFISPVFYFNELTYIQTLPTSSLVPKLYVYQRVKLAAGVYSL